MSSRLQQINDTADTDFFHFSIKVANMYYCPSRRCMSPSQCKMFGYNKKPEALKGFCFQRLLVGKERRPSIN